MTTHDTHRRPLAPTAALLIAALATLSACEAPTRRNNELKPQDIQALRDKANEKASLRSQSANSRLSPEQQRQVIALVNGDPITLGEFEQRLNDQPPFVRARYNTVPRKREFLDNMIQFEILADHARKLGYDKHPDVLLNLKQAMVRKMRADELDERVALRDVSEEAIRAWYDGHKSDYVRPEQVRVSQIVLPTRDEMDATIKELEAGFAEDPTHKRRTFGAMARKRSIDGPTANQGGDMGFFPRPEDGGTVTPVLSEAAFALEKVSQMSAPIQTPDGHWHLLMLTGRKQAYVRTFEDARRSIAQRLYREKRALAEKDLIATARADAKITVDEELLKSIPDPEPDAEQPKAHDHSDETPRDPTPSPDKATDDEDP